MHFYCSSAFLFYILRHLCYTVFTVRGVGVMIYTKLNEAEIFEGATNKTYEYNINDKDINYCVAEIDGRFPKEKWAINRKCKEMAHILSGSGILVVENKKYQIEKDDVVLIDINEKYYWEGQMKLGISGTPAWYPEQHECID